MIEIESVARRLDKREDARVVAYREVGLPIFRLNCLITMQETTSLGTIEEFVLRCLSQDINSSSDMQAFLGLPSKIVAHQLGQLIFEGAITQIDSAPPKYALTKAGRTRIDGAASVRISREQLPIYVDGITRQVVVVADPRDLWSNAQLEKAAIAVVPPTPRKVPRSSEVDLSEINRMLAAASPDEKLSKRVVRLDATIGRVALVFRRAIALAYKSDDGRRVSIGYVIDGRESEEHEVTYARSPHPERSVVFGALFSADRRRREIQLVARELRTDLPEIFPDGELGSDGRTVVRVKKRKRELGRRKRVTARPISVYEHAPLMMKALEGATKRLVVVSPWVRASVVNGEFIKALAACLERDTRVTIGYGLGRHDQYQRVVDEEARAALGSLSSGFKNLELCSKHDMRARVLLMDQSLLVVTTFDWLSYGGDPTRPMREEEGHLVEEAELIERYYKILSERLSPSSRIDETVIPDTSV
jgi:hypothetical protein